MNNDSISRTAAIDAFMEILDRPNHAEFLYTDEICGVLKNLPPVQPRRGKWIGYKADDKDWQRDDGSPVFMNCSECHEAVINNGSAHWNFCPSCGADMRPQFEEPEINPCRGCEDYDGKGGCKTKGGCAGSRGDSDG